MPKAVVTTKSGSKYTIEGTQDEVAALMKWLEGSRSEDCRPVARLGEARAGPSALISELIAEGFFDKPRELSEIRLALEQRGHFYPATTLSPVMLHMVKKKELRRLKEKKRWVYVR